LITAFEAVGVESTLLSFAPEHSSLQGFELTARPKKKNQKLTMLIRLGKKKYKSFDRAAAAVAKKKGISKERAKAYVAVVDRKQHKKKK
jgi:hypothetical protein